MHLLTNTQGAKMRLFRLSVTALICVKDGEIIEHGSDIGMIRPELFLVDLQRV